MISDSQVKAVTSLLHKGIESIVLPRFDCLENGQIQDKGGGDLVTIADIEMENFLIDQLPKIIPNSRVIGEETFPKSPIENMELMKGGEFVWLVDPVDGTLNFARSDHRFGTMVALLSRGNAIASWIVMPKFNITATAVLNQGVMINDLPLLDYKAKHEPLAQRLDDQSSWNGKMKWVIFDKSIRDDVKNKTHSQYGHITHTNCAASDFIDQILGRTRFAFYQRLWWWDHAPGGLLLSEAGGVVMGANYNHPYQSCDIAHLLLTASDQHVWDHLYAFIHSFDSELLLSKKQI